MTKSNFFLLFKVYLRGAFDVRRYKKKKVALTSFIAFFSLMAVIYLILSILINLSLFVQMRELGGSYNSVIIIAGGYCTLITFSTSIFRAKGIFNGNDYEMLKALPIKEKEIIFAKILGMYIVELAYSLIILLPNMVMTIIFTGNLMYLLYGSLLIVLVPCFPIMLAVLIGSILTLLIDGSRFASIINVFAYFILMVACILFSTMQSSKQINGIASLFIYINPSLLFFEWALAGKYLYFAVFILLNLAILTFTILFIAKLYNIGHAVSDVSTKERKHTTYKNQSGFKSLMNIEYKKIFTSKLYLLNSISGGIASIAVIVSLFVTINNSADVISSMKDYIYMLALIPMIFSGIAVPSSSTFSAEGKRIWLLKTLPVETKKIFNAKLLVSYSISSVANIISIVLLGILFKASWFDWLAFFSVNILYLMLCNLIGLALNSKFCRFDWTEEREVFKNSLSVGLSVGICFLIEIISCGVLIGLGIINRWLGLSTAIFLFVVSSYVIYNYLIKNSTKILMKME